MIVFPTAQEAGDAAALVENDKDNKHFQCIPEQLLDGSYIVGCYIKVLSKDPVANKGVQLKFAEWL